MILRVDRWLTELPPPSDPDPDGAAVVQELMGGRFGEMSTFMNYTSAAKALTGYLLVRGGVHQVAYARALENLTGARLEKLFPSPQIATEKIPECRPHIENGDHARLYRFSPDDYNQLAAVFNGDHPETGDPLEVVDEDTSKRPEPVDLPAQPAVFAPGYAPEDIAEIADKLRKDAGISG